MPLASEHSVTQLKQRLLGGTENKGFRLVKTLNIKKWFRKSKAEEANKSNTGLAARLSVVWSFIPAEQTRLALEHWVSYLAKSGQIIRLYFNL